MNCIDNHGHVYSSAETACVKCHNESYKGYPQGKTYGVGNKAYINLEPSKETWEREVDRVKSLYCPVINMDVEPYRYEPANLEVANKALDALIAQARQEEREKIEAEWNRAVKSNSTTT